MAVTRDKARTKSSKALNWDVTRDSQPEGSLSGWTISCKAELPGGQQVSAHPTLHQRAAKALKGHGPVTKVKGSSFTVIFGVDSPDALDAQNEAEPLLKSVLHELHLDAASVREIRLVPNTELERELEQLPHCVGVGEAADILGVSKQRVGQLAQRPDFPQPVFRLRATPVWRDTEIREFAKARELRSRRSDVKNDAVSARSSKRA